MQDFPFQTTQSTMPWKVIGSVCVLFSCDYRDQEPYLEKCKVHGLLASGSCKLVTGRRQAHNCSKQTKYSCLIIFFFKHLCLPSKTLEQSPPGLRQLQHLILLSKSSLTCSRQTVRPVEPCCFHPQCQSIATCEGYSASSHRIPALWKPRAQRPFPSPVTLIF